MADNGDERKHTVPSSDPAEADAEKSHEDDSDPNCIDPPDNQGGGDSPDSEPSATEDDYMAMDDD